MLKSGLLQGIYVPKTQTLEDRSLVRDRKELVTKQTRIKNQIKSKLSFFGFSIPEHFASPGSHWSARFIKWLESLQFRTNSGRNSLESLIRQLKFYRSEILNLTQQIRDLSKSERYNEQSKILLSCPGIGVCSAMTLLTEIECIRRFKSMNKLLSFIGLVPTERSSGEKYRKGQLIKRMNIQLRNVIIEASWVAIRADPGLAEFYNSCCSRMKKQKAIIKVGKKLLSKIFYIWNNEELYIKGIV